MTVTGRAKDIPKLASQSGSTFGISPSIGKLAKDHGEHIEGIDIGSQSEGNRLIVFLDLKGAKDSIPNDKNSSVVSIEIKGVASVVNSVVRGSVEYPLKGPKLANELGMDPVLVDETYAVSEYDLFWCKSE